MTDDDSDDTSGPQTRRERRAARRGVRGRGGRAAGIANLVEDAAGSGKTGGFLSKLLKGGGGKFARLGGGLARGALGGVGGLAAGLALQFGGDAAINKFVKNDDDANSLSRGLGAVATGAGIGATVGSIIPGVGTVIGGAVGAGIGGAYSLVKDKNLRNFVGGKISSGAKAVGNFASRAGGAVSDFFGGNDEDGKELSTGGKIKRVAGAALGGVGALLGGTDIGKSITDGLGKAGDATKNFVSAAGKTIGDFFTKTIPRFISNGIVKPVGTFFTETLPSLPGKFFDAFTTGAGIAFGLLTKTLPRLAKKLFTETLPNLASDAWEGLKKNLFEPIGEFVTVTIPNFFTETIPQWFSSAKGFLHDNVIDPITSFIQGIPGFFTETIPQWFASAQEWIKTSVRDPLVNFITVEVPKFFTETIPEWFAKAPAFFDEHVKQPVTNFFTVTIPEFFTTTLPNAIESLPGFLYDNLVQPVLDFFGGIAGHVGDFLKGSFDWAKNLFTRGSENFEKGSESVSMSGGLVKGVYQGIEDNQKYRLTSGEFVLRRGVMEKPGAKAFARDWNEGRFDPASLYAGLSAAATPQVMSIVPPTAPNIATGVSNTTVDNSRQQGLHVGDITINNPVRERSDRSLRRTLQTAAIRHRL